MEENVRNVRLQLNAQECNVVKVNSRKKGAVKVGQNVAKEVECFRYPGSNYVAQDGEDAGNIRNRLALTNAVFGKLSKVMLATTIGRRRTKVTLFKSAALSVLLYGYETRKLIKEEENRLDTFQT